MKADRKSWLRLESIFLRDIANAQSPRQGAQGILDGASDQSLDSEFGTKKEEDVVKIILEKGEVQQTENSERQGDTNLTQGSRIAH